MAGLGRSPLLAPPQEKVANLSHVLSCYEASFGDCRGVGLLRVIKDRTLSSNSRGDGVLWDLSIATKVKGQEMRTAVLRRNTRFPRVGGYY